MAFALALSAFDRLPPERYFADYLVSVSLGGIAFSTVGALIVSRRPNNPMGWLYAAIGLGFGWSTWLNQYAHYGLVTSPGSLPAASFIGWLNLWSGVPALLAVVLIVPLLFPDGRLPTPRWQPVVWVAIVAIVLFTSSWAISPGPIDSSQPNVPNPFAPPNAERILAVLGPVANVLCGLGVVGSVAAVIARFRGAGEIERRQLEWFGYGVGVLLIALLVPIAVGIFVFRNFPGDTLLSGVLLSIGFPAVPLATGAAILRHRLYDIDRLLNRTLVYAALTACVLMVYALAVGYLSSFFRASDNVLIGLAATGLVAVLFEPLRARLQRAVDRLLYGERDAPYRALARLGEQLQSTLAPDDVFRHVVATVHDALGRPTYVALELQGTDGTSTSATATGAPAGEAQYIDLAYRGERVGRLAVSGYDGDRKLLEGAATHAAAAVHAVQLAERLQHAREQLVLAREEERRRLRHDLHDELAPTLAGLALTAATARDLLDRDGNAARSLVGELQVALRAAVGDVRRLAHDLRPPVLDELGLLAALHDRAQQFETSSLRVEVQAPAALPRLPAAVEVAAYRIGSEALLNVVRHAVATCCSVRLSTCDGWLRLEVLDDGVGIRDRAVAGVGLRSMRERALELGGTLQVEARPEGGTRVAAELPLGADAGAVTDVPLAAEAGRG